MNDHRFQQMGFPATEKSIRLFAAVVPGKTEIDQLSSFINQLKHEQWAANIRWIKPENIHMTLRFFGDTDEQAYRCLTTSMGPFMEDTSAFDISLSQVICLPSVSKVRVIAVGVRPHAALTHLASCSEKAARDCGFEAEKRRFLGHFTLGRCKPLDLRDTIMPQDAEGLRIGVKSVELIRSVLSPSGSVYKTLESIPLKP